MSQTSAGRPGFVRPGRASFTSAKGFNRIGTQGDSPPRHRLRTEHPYPPPWLQDTPQSAARSV
ncbi:hypothetical protein [Azospirillum argentinense]|uniref:Uncharacterized protein n=1 Tax=Azospirillum argentinense TaxID=2970906 RepID=A0A5B0L3D7_9PROT|nr:hypothetical protein FH063_001049 [Azospirillum argentinense]